MENDYRNEVYRMLEEKNGRHYQVAKVIQELSELAVELTKILLGEVNEKDLCDELADAEVGIEQIKRFFNLDDAVDMNKDYKIHRVKVFELREEQESGTELKHVRENTIVVPSMDLD